MRKVYKNVSLIIILLTVFASKAAYVSAANLLDWSKKLEDAAGPGGAGYQTSGVTGPEPLISTIIQVALSFLGVIFLVLMIYGGYLWMTARGNEEQVTKAKNLITAAIIGLVIVISAYAISWLVISKLGGETLTPS